MTSSSAFRIALVGLASLGLSVGIGRFAFTPLLPMMRADGLLGVTGGGWLASVHFLGYWLGALVAARVPCPPRVLLRLSLLVIGLGTIAMGLTESYVAWLVLRWLAGVCSAWALIIVSNYYIRHLADSGNKALQGWVFAGVGGGIALAGLICLVFMVAGTGSMASWQIIGAATLVGIAVVSFSIGSELPTGRPAPRRSHDGSTPLNWRAIIAYSASGMGYTIPATYLPYMARETIHDPLVFGWVWPIFGVAALLSTVLAGRLHNRFSPLNQWIVCQIVMALGLLLPVLDGGIVTLTVSGLCVGGTFVIVTMAGMQEMHRTAPADDAMHHIAAMTTGFATGQMIGPVFASTLHDLTGSFAPSFAITSALLVATVLTLTDRRTKVVTAAR